MTISKIQTNNSLMDNLVYYLKILVYETILKDETEALNDESLESIRASDLFIACKENKVIFEMLDYTEDVLIESGITPDLISLCLADKNNIPKEFRPLVITNMRKYIISSYVELNNYYRKLAGLPDLKAPGIKLTESTNAVDTATTIYFTISASISKAVDLDKYLHEMNDAEIDVIKSNGILEDLMNTYDYGYLFFINSGKIDIYVARKASKFGILYIPTIDNASILEKFRRKLEINRVFVLKTMYSDAMKVGNDYYDNFITMFIKIQTMCDMIIEVPEMLIRRDFFDMRTIKDLLESNGIMNFDSIPKKYLLAMIKNLNTLIKYKSTDKNIVDICSLFGFSDIEVFKYYLLKDRKTDGNGNFTFVFKEDPDHPGTQIMDNDANFDLKFIKVPIDSKLDEYIRNNQYHVSYEELTEDDPYWLGDNTSEYVKSKILQNEFNTVQSKYMSIDTIIDMSKLSFELSYFFSMVLSSKDLEENLQLKVKVIDADHFFKFTDIICYLYILTYELNGVVDTIMDTTGKVLHINGFNFQADMAELGAYVKERGYTLEQLGVSDFTIPTNGILSFNQLISIFTKNKAVRDHLIEGLTTSNNDNIYKIYKKLYDALMITELNNSIFKKADESPAATYTEYINGRDIILSNSISYIRTLLGDEKRDYIMNIMNEVLITLEEYIDTSKFQFMFTNIPSMSSELVKSYIFKTINFFKSYKLDLASINTIYKFDDKLDNKIMMLDKAIIECVYFQKPISIDLIEKINMLISLVNKDILPLNEVVSYSTTMTSKDNASIVLEKYIVTLGILDKDIIDFHFKDKAIINTSSIYKDSCIPDEYVFISQY